MKGVENRWSYSSYDNLTECLKHADPKSEVFAKLKLGRVQVSKIVNETGLSISPSLFWQNA